MIYDMAGIIEQTGSEFELYNKGTFVNQYTGATVDRPTFVKKFKGCLQPLLPNLDTTAEVLSVKGGYVYKSQHQFYTTEKITFEQEIHAPNGEVYDLIKISDWSFHGNYYEYIIGTATK